MRVAEIHLHVQRGRDAFVQGELASLVPGQRVPQELGQVLHFPDDGLPDVFGVVPVGQVQEDREPCRAFHERADRAFVGRAADQVAFPMTGYRPVLDFGGPLADHDHGLAETGLARVRLPVRPALGAPAPQGLDDVLFQFAFGLDVDGLVDRLRAHMHSIIIREIGAQAPRDLLGTPMRPQSCTNVCEQAGHRMDLRGLGSSEPVRAHLLGPVRLVHAGRGIRVAHQLAAGGRRETIERARDPAHAHAGLPPVGDADALVLAQIPRTDLLGNVHGGTIPVHRWLLVPAVRSCPSVAPHLAGAFGHAHRPRGLREVHAHLEMLDVPASPRRAHLAMRRVLHTLERPPAHPILLPVDQMLQRSLEPAQWAFCLGGGIVFGIGIGAEGKAGRRLRKI